MKSTMITMRIICGLAILALSGCDSGTRKVGGAAAISTAPGPRDSKYTVEQAIKLRSQGAPRAADSNPTPTGGDKSDDKSSAPATTPPAADPNAGRVKAEPGVGAAGQDLGGGYLGVTFQAYFGAKEKIAFDQMEYALKNFKALNDHFPKSHAEFMEKIIKENGIKLPDLPAGNVYEYDPKTGVLNVGAAADSK